MSDQQILTQTEQQIINLQPQINTLQPIQPPLPMDIGTGVLGRVGLISTIEDPFLKQIMIQHCYQDQILNYSFMLIRELLNSNIFYIKEIVNNQKTHNQNKTIHYSNQTQQRYQKNHSDLMTVQIIFQIKLKVIIIKNVYQLYPMATSSPKCFNMQANIIKFNSSFSMLARRNIIDTVLNPTKKNTLFFKRIPKQYIISFQYLKNQCLETKCQP
ncbi:unnamed protein product [Paramecium primaurelia]|uniref:Uncharacterized protein n=1 Tax=Paramecium primaurelia TaxID=5886 RepID=A0A8S1QNG3_PARPR|nr:unnamed protein product [Paramecium primaurelia]CAD8116033.1 unnamed protein product [Paramecium primaurelia]